MTIATISKVNLSDLTANDLTINTTGLVRCGPSWSWHSPRNHWTDLDLWVVLDGQGTLNAGNHTFSLKRGDTFILHGNDTYRGEQDRQHPLLVSFTHFDLLEPGGGIITGQCPPPRLHRNISDSLFMKGLLTRLYQAHLIEPNCLSARQWLVTTLHLIQELDTQSPQTAQGTLHAHVIHDICAAMADDPLLTWSVHDQARRCNWSADHYCRSFKKVHGISPQEYGIRLRMNLAIARLQQERLPIHQLAEELGYQDSHYFSRQFKKQTGQSPVQWQRLH